MLGGTGQAALEQLSDVSLKAPVSLSVWVNALAQTVKPNEEGGQKTYPLNLGGENGEKTYPERILENLPGSLAITPCDIGRQIDTMLSDADEGFRTGVKMMNADSRATVLVLFTTGVLTNAHCTGANKV